MAPARLFRAVAVGEAVTWALLLFGMFLKYGAETTELGVRVFGLVHGVVFIAYCLTTLVVAIDQRWSPGRTLLALAASIPPFFTVLLDVLLERRGAFSAQWRLVTAVPERAIERPVAWVLRRPVQGVLALLAAVAVLTLLVLAVGPPVGR